MTVEYAHLFHPRYNGNMKDAGTNKRGPLTALLTLFVIGSTFIAYSLAQIIGPARTVFHEKVYYKSDVVFSEDIECLDKFSQVSLEIEHALKNDDPEAIKPVTFRKGKAYELEAYVQYSAVNDNWHCNNYIRIKCDDGKRVPADPSGGAGESKEFHNRYLDGTYVTVIGFDKFESHEGILSEYKKATEDILSTYRTEEAMRTVRIHVLPVCMTLTATLAVSALALFLRRKLTAAGKSSKFLTVIFVIIDIPVAGLLLLFLFSLINPYFILL